ncbi:hypothetical protein, partial [Azotobacter vinelandii]
RIPFGYRPVGTGVVYNDEQPGPVETPYHLTYALQLHRTEIAAQQHETIPSEAVDQMTSAKCSSPSAGNAAQATEKATDQDIVR